MRLPKSNDLIYRKACNELWLREGYLLQLLTQLSADYLRVKARPQYKASVQKCQLKNTWLPDTGKSWRYAKIKGAFYYDYNTISDKAPTHYLSQLPSKKELIQLLTEASVQEEILPIETFLKPYLDEDYKEFFQHYGDCTKQQQINLSKAAAALKAAIDYIQNTGVCLHKNDFFLSYAEILAKQDIGYIPKNYRCFKRLVIAAIEENKAITELIKLPRAGNPNAVKHLCDPELESWIIQMRLCGRNYTDQYIVRKVQYMCMISEKPKPSERWLEGVMEKHNTKWLTSPTRFGDKGRQGQMYRGYIPLTNALYAGDCWQVDGTRVNLVDFKLNNKNVFLYIVAVRDVHSGDVLGYSFDISENRWVVHNALKMAVEETGYLPYQLVMDRFPGHNTSEMESLFSDLENRGVKISWAHKATGKAKLERWFSTMQQVFMQESNYYYGEGIQSRNKFAHRSKEQLLKMKKDARADGWDFDKAVNESCKLIEAYRSTKLSYYSRKFKTIEQSPAQLHQASEKLHITELQDNQLVYLFGLRTQKKFTGEGLLTIDIQNYPFSYRCSDPEIVSRYDRVTICYSLEDLNTVHLYEISDKPLKKYLGTAEEVSVQVYGPDAEWKKLNQQKAIIASMDQERQRQLSMKLAAGSEVTMMLGGVVGKDEYESNETMHLIKEMGSDTDDSDEYDVRSQY